MAFQLIGRRGAILTLLVVTAGLLMIATARSRHATGQAIAAADIQAAGTARSQAAGTARSQAGILTSELQKFRLLPDVLAEYPDVAAALATPNAAPVARLNRSFELLARRTDAAGICLINAKGLTLAASYWRLPASFAGSNYAVRPCFRDAMRTGTSEMFALGTVSGRPGLYRARRPDIASRLAGIIVVKAEFDRVEQLWARASGSSCVADGHGVVLITSVPEWRFRATRPLDSATRAQVRQTLQFGNNPAVGGARYRQA